MRSYDPDDRKSRYWAIAALALYGALLVVAFRWLSFDFSAAVEKPSDTIFVEFVEPPLEPQPIKTSVEPRVHDMPDEQTPQEAPVSGSDEITRSPDPRALFSMSKSSGDEPVETGNPHAREGRQQSAGQGPGLSPDGLDQIDKGLQGRGLVGNLPQPAYPGSRSGKVVVRVSVGPKGDVTSAAFEPKGSTVSDPQLIEAALEAARKARFTESRAAVQGGTITYVFRMN